MRIRFQSVPWDLYGLVIYAVVVSAVLLAAGSGNLLGALLTVFVPGYLAAAALLPRRGQADVLLRIALSVGLSLALVAFLGVVLNFTPWGITLASVTTGILLVSVLLAAVAYYRRMAVPADARLGLSLDMQLARWSEYSLIEKLLAVILVAVLIVAVPLLGYAFTKPRPSAPFTELYLLSPTGNFTGYPSQLNVSQPGTLEVVVANHEAQAVNYTLRVDLVGVRIVYNATSRTNDTVELNRTTWTWDNRSLGDGDAWTQTYTFTISAAGTWQIQFVLNRDGDLTTAYREAAFLVTVS